MLFMLQAAKILRSGPVFYWQTNLLFFTHKKKKSIKCIFIVSDYPLILYAIVLCALSNILKSFYLKGKIINLHIQNLPYEAYCKSSINHDRIGLAHDFCLRP